MKTIDKNRLRETLIKLGIKPGAGLLVHSAVQYLGTPVGGIAMYFDTIDEIIQTSRAGTLCVPAFNFAFARGSDYDALTTPSEGMGAFSEFVRTHPGTRRTLHPMQSLAVIGNHAVDITSRDTHSAFDQGSAFERILELDFELLLLGADIQAVSLVHYSEQRLPVPYRYWKEFHGRIKTGAGWEQRSYRMFVRDLKHNPVLNLRPIQQELEKRSLWRSLPVNYGQVSACKLVDFVSATDTLLQADPWALVEKVDAKIS